MGKKDIELARSNSEKSSANQCDVSFLSYGKLFELNPGYKLMFPGSIVDLERKFLLTVKVWVSGLADFISFVPFMQDRVRRPVEEREFQRKDYDIDAIVLLAALQQGSGAQFNSKLRSELTAIHPILTKTTVEEVRKPLSNSISKQPSSDGISF
ncbi:hemin receptor [Leptospira sp. 201903070]|uniref:Hemin receptor n=1 Tax=Leptospira ainlahdjerensis TaxID=2810033 RepID=A0ABS2UD40_9LEPT|nr:hemin receptor [Leptospira ainlahdjerensis]MBM9578291.1 hemin receptor [Leptospira ainlahdjerensis]